MKAPTKRPVATVSGSTTPAETKTKDVASRMGSTVPVKDEKPATPIGTEAIPTSKLEHWVKNSLNVLLIGYHGCGKSMVLLSLFERLGIKAAYYSCSTLDPWVDFVGCPSATDDGKGGKYLDIVPPKTFASDDVEVIILDEFNRSHSKVRNAAMELIQFKSINGRKLGKLRMVWACINPPDDENSPASYQVEEIDPAQLDRFQIHYTVPYMLSTSYLYTQFDRFVVDAIDNFWTNLDLETRLAFSPRRVEAAIREYLREGGDVRDVLPRKVSMHAFLNCFLEARANRESYEEHTRKVGSRPGQIQRTGVEAAGATRPAFSSALGFQRHLANAQDLRQAVQPILDQTKEQREAFFSQFGVTRTTLQQNQRGLSKTVVEDTLTKTGYLYLACIASVILGTESKKPSRQVWAKVLPKLPRSVLPKLQPLFISEDILKRDLILGMPGEGLDAYIDQAYELLADRYDAVGDDGEYGYNSLLTLNLGSSIYTYFPELKRELPVIGKADPKSTKSKAVDKDDADVGWRDQWSDDCDDREDF